MRPNNHLAALGMSLAFAAAMVPAAGCGDDGGGSGSGPASATGDEASIRKLFKDFEAAYQAGDGERACRMLTAAARAEAAGLRGDGQTCQQSVARIGATMGDIEQQPSKILSVRVDGDRATASISDAGRPPVELPFVREDGGWKIAELGFGS